MVSIIKINACKVITKIWKIAQGTDNIHCKPKGWVCEIDKQITGFAIADLKENNIWALFLLPAFEKQGIGKRLHDMMIDWHLSSGLSAAAQKNFGI